jgi:predicted NAD/FAD-binding protein
MSRIAVIGSGISGMAAAYLLSRSHEVWLFEQEGRLGGHTHTHAIDAPEGPLAIDSGFIVHNDRTYPNFVQLLRKLGIARRPSDMSFGVSCQETGFEYSSRGLRGLFSGSRNWLRPGHYRFLSEILRFNREARSLLRNPVLAEITLGEYLREHRFHGDFMRYYLHPMAAAVWSTSLDEIDMFPTFTLLRFFENHGFLGLTTQAKWFVIDGGSSAYIAPLTGSYTQRIRVRSNITSVERNRMGVRICFQSVESQNFDEIVFACHAPQALALLFDASSEEKRILSLFRTSRNETVLHTDSRLLPRAASARASWNYHLGAGNRGATVTYHMNRLQNLHSVQDFCVTLNNSSGVQKDRILREMVYFHPLFTLDAIRAQAQWSVISGKNHTHFCGAYWFSGFHEDGLNSAIRVAENLGVSWNSAMEAGVV